jgi:hypothetical protein
MLRRNLAVSFIVMALLVIFGFSYAINMRGL